MKKIIVISTLFLSIFSFPLAGVAAKKTDSVSAIQKAADQACSSNQDKASCEKLIWITAKVTMVNTSFYLQSCSDKEKIKNENKVSCQEAERLMNKISSIK